MTTRNGCVMLGSPLSNKESMKEALKHLRIAVAHIFFAIAHKIDARDREDLEAEFRRLDPDYGKTGNVEGSPL